VLGNLTTDVSRRNFLGFRTYTLNMGRSLKAFARVLLDHELPTICGVTDLQRTVQLERYMVPGLTLLTKNGKRINNMLEGLVG
jgi:hypothetical protein